MTAEQIRALSKEELTMMYNTHASITSLASKLETNRALMSQILYEKDIISISSLDFEIPEKKIIETYKNLGLKRAAVKLGVRSNLLSVKIKKLNISNFDTSSFWENLITPRALQDLLNEGKTLYEIARMFDKNDTRSLRAYIKHNNLIVQPRHNQYGLAKELTLDSQGLDIIQYYNMGLSYASIAKKTNTTSHAVERFLKRNGIVLTSLDKRGIPPEKIQEELYTTTLSFLAKRLDVGKEELSLYCLYHKIIPGLHFNRDTIVEEYYNLGSIAGVSKKFGITVDNAAKILKSCGVDTSKNIPTKEEIEKSVVCFLEKTKGIFSEDGWMAFSGFDRDQLRHYFGSSKEIKHYFKIRQVSVQDSFLNFFENITGISLIREANLGCIYPKTHGRLRFDGFNIERSLIIEFDDASHFFDNRNIWKDPLEERVARDRFKDKWAEENGYVLIRFKYTEPWTKENVINTLLKNGVKIEEGHS